MYSHIPFGVVVIVLLGAYILFGCAAKEDAQMPEVEPEAVERVEITFDGESCSYDGPKVIFEDEVVVAINNVTEAKAVLEVNLLPEEKTWQDVLDYYQIQEEGRAEWLGQVHNTPILSEPNGKKFTFEPGLYAILCLEITETGARIHTGTYLDVSSAP